MAQRSDAARGREIIERWCVIAEQRLEHLTELFETGRWRRYHSEASFLENIQEAKSAVEAWRSLATREARLDNTAIDLSWLDRAKPVPPRVPLLPYYRIDRLPPWMVEYRAEPAALSPPTAPHSSQKLADPDFPGRDCSEREFSERALAARPFATTEIPPCDTSAREASAAGSFETEGPSAAARDVASSASAKEVKLALEPVIAIAHDIAAAASGNIGSDEGLNLAIMQQRYPLLRNSL